MTRNLPNIAKKLAKCAVFRVKQLCRFFGKCYANVFLPKQQEFWKFRLVVRNDSYNKRYYFEVLLSPQHMMNIQTTPGTTHSRQERGRTINRGRTRVHSGRGYSGLGVGGAEYEAKQEPSEQRYNVVKQ